MFYNRSCLFLYTLVPLFNLDYEAINNGERKKNQNGTIATSIKTEKISFYHSYHCSCTLLQTRPIGWYADVRVTYSGNVEWLVSFWISSNALMYIVKLC